VGVVGGNTATPSRAERGDAGAVLAGDGVDVGHELEVLALGVVDEGDVGAAIAASGRSRRVVHAELDDGHACAPRRLSRRRSNVSGTPMSLLKLPAVAKAASPCQARKIAAIICVTVVLPLLPARRQRQVEAAPPGAGESPSAAACRRPRAGQPGGSDAALGQRRGGAAAAASAEELVGVEALARAGRRNRSPGAGCACRCAPGDRRRRVADAGARRQQGGGSPSVAIGERRHAAAAAHRCPPRTRRSRAPLRRSRRAAAACAADRPGSPRGPCRR
jgi:hypothetical protein